MYTWEAPLTILFLSSLNCMMSLKWYHTMVFPKSLRFSFPFTKRNTYVENKVFFCWHYCLFSNGWRDWVLIFSLSHWWGYRLDFFLGQRTLELLFSVRSFYFSFTFIYSLNIFLRLIFKFLRLIFKSELQSYKRFSLFSGKDEKIYDSALWYPNELLKS